MFVKNLRKFFLSVIDFLNKFIKKIKNNNKNKLYTNFLINLFCKNV